MTKPVYDLILGCRTALVFQTKEVTIDESILPMRDINSLNTSTMEMDRAVNISMAYEPHNMQEATQRLLHILDAKYEKADLQ